MQQDPVKEKDTQQQIFSLFQSADTLLFKDKQYFEAEKLYRQIIEFQFRLNNTIYFTKGEINTRNIVDALNSIGYCVKYRSTVKDIMQGATQGGDQGKGQEKRKPDDIEIDMNNLHEVGKKVSNGSQRLTTFQQLQQIYTASLKLDPNDVEANFNIASLYLQVQDTQKALKHYRKCVKKDETPAD